MTTDTKFLRLLSENAAFEAEEHLNTASEAAENGNDGVAIAASAAGAVMASMVAIFRKTAEQLTKE